MYYISIYLSPQIQKVVLYMSGFYTNWDLGLHLAEAFLELKSLKVLQISIKCVIETSFLVDFICECFEKNDHIDALSLEGAMNVAENLTKTENKRVQRQGRRSRGGQGGQGGPRKMPLKCRPTH